MFQMMKVPNNAKAKLHDDSNPEPLSSPPSFVPWRLTSCWVVQRRLRGCSPNLVPRSWKQTDNLWRCWGSTSLHIILCWGKGLTRNSMHHAYSPVAASRGIVKLNTVAQATSVGRLTELSASILDQLPITIPGLEAFAL